MISNLLLLASAIYIYVDAMRMRSQRLHFVKNFAFMFLQSCHLCFYLLQLQEPGLNYICYRKLADMRFSWPDGCRKLIFKSCSTLHSLTTPTYHFSSYLHATYLFRRKDSVVILPKHASPVMLNEPASASSSAVRLYALEFTGLKKW